MVEGDQLVVPAKRASPLPKARYHKRATPIGVRGVTTHFPAPPVLPIFVSADFEPSELPKSFWYVRPLVVIYLSELHRLAVSAVSAFWQCRKDVNSRRPNRCFKLQQ